MSKEDMDFQEHEDSGGYVLVGVMILLAISAIMVATALDFAATSSKTILSEKVRTREYYQAEDSLAKATSWIRDNSKNLTSVFNRSNFYTTFDRTNPTYGSNDSGTVRVLTKIKMQGTSNSAILANSATLATALFPNTVNTSTGASFNPVAQFSAGSFGSDIVRVTLVDAVAVDPTKDYGDPDLGNAAPATDFYPVFRVDAMKATDRGAHVYGYAVGNLIYDYGVGFYGRDVFEMRQGCDSYLSNNGNYSSASRRANCTTGSNGTLQIHQNETLYGSAQTNGSINESSPFGGAVCSDFSSGCPNAGLKCAGASCGVPGLPAYNSWASYCPTNRGNPDTNNQTLTVSGNAASQKCWATVDIGSSKTLTLTSTNYPYFFDTLKIHNNGALAINPSPSTGTVTIYVRNWDGNKFNGNQVLNANNKPYQLRIHYLGTNALTLNGNAQMRAFLVSPYAAVSVQGNFDYYGGIKATSLTFTGNGDIHYDESGDITTLGDTQYSLRNIIQRYR